MMKRCLAVLLALLMLALPLAASAETSFLTEAIESGRMAEVTVGMDVTKLYPTGDDATDAIIRDILNALSLRFYVQRGSNAQGGFDVRLDGTDVLSFDAARWDGTLYLVSDLLNDGVITLEPGDGPVVLTKLADTLQNMGALDESDRAAFDEMIQALGEGGLGMTVDADALEAVFDEEDMDERFLQKLEEAGLKDKAREIDVSTQPEGSDPAAKAYEVTLSPDDCAAYIDIVIDLLKENAEYMKMLDDTLASADMTGKDMLDAMAQSMRESITQSLGNVVILCYLDADEEIVAMDVNFTVKAEDAEETTPVHEVYTRQTVDDSVEHHVRMATIVDDVPFLIEAVYHDEDDLKTFAMDIVDDSGKLCVIDAKATEEEGDTAYRMNAQADITLRNTDETEMILNLGLDVSETRDGQDAKGQYVATIGLDGEEALRLTVDAATGDPIPTIVSDDAIRLATLDDTAFQDWFVGIVNNLQTWVVSLLQAMPASVLMGIMEMAQ